MRESVVLPRSRGPPFSSDRGDRPAKAARLWQAEEAAEFTPRVPRAMAEIASCLDLQYAPGLLAVQ